jgi:hypothetical protein
MNTRNPLPGHVKLPGKEEVDREVRLDFNSLVGDAHGRTRIEGFNLRMFTIGKFGEEHPEISVDLTPEQWLDLIEAMRNEFDVAQRDLKTLEEEEGQS